MLHTVVTFEMHRAAHLQASVRHRIYSSNRGRWFPEPVCIQTPDLIIIIQEGHRREEHLKPHHGDESANPRGRSRQQDTQPDFVNKQITRQNKTGRGELQIKTYLKYTSIVHNVGTPLAFYYEILQNTTYKTNRNVNTIWIFDDISILLNF